jgi:hypothetical protein
MLVVENVPCPRTLAGRRVQLLEIVANLQLVTAVGAMRLPAAVHQAPTRLFPETACNAPSKDESRRISNSKEQDSYAALLKELLQISLSIALHKRITGRKP